MDTFELTPISWIGITKFCGDEWSSYTKKIELSDKPDFAAIRVDSQGVCGIFVNGEFVESSCGRYIHRITYVEITSFLHQGENEIMLQLGNHFFQTRGELIRERRGSWFSAVAAEIEIKIGGCSQTIVTDEYWQVCSDEGQIKPQVFSNVNQADYSRFWSVATLIREPKKLFVPDAVAQVAGEKYVSYAMQPWKKWAEPKEIIEDISNDEGRHIIYDFGRIQVGYLTLEYEAKQDSNVTIFCEYLERVDDLDDEKRIPWVTPVVEKLMLSVPVKQGKHTTTIVRRRASRFVKLQIPNGVQVFDIRFKLSLMPSEYTGWFSCSDAVLNTMWEVGQYTLLANKHQEYESCPRHEMKFFSGDGYLEALIDYYAFGDNSLVTTSLALTEPSGAVGIRRDVYEMNTGLWDYPAWRILMVYNQYFYYKDRVCVERYYEELTESLLWMMHRTGKDGLIFQYPVWGGPFYDESDSVEYTCSFDRLGEKPFLNALYYQSLLCMAELADVMGDYRAEKWRAMASQVHKSFNDRLWSEEAGAYVDTYDRSYVPQDGNALALLFGLADERQSSLVMKTLQKKCWTPYGSTILDKHMTHTMNGNETISPLMQSLEIEARFLCGDTEGAMELTRRFWGTMLKKGAGTFWEYSPNDELARWFHQCHGWAGGCTYLLSAYVLGIRPETPAYDTVHFEPYEGIETLAGVVPTARGLIAVKGTTVLGKKHYELAVPKGVRIHSILPKQATIQITEYEKEDIS